MNTVADAARAGVAAYAASLTPHAVRSVRALDAAFARAP